MNLTLYVNGFLNLIVVTVMAMMMMITMMMHVLLPAFFMESSLLSIYIEDTCSSFISDFTHFVVSL